MRRTGIIERDLFKIYWAKIGSVFCKRYEGTFRSRSLQDKANTGLWYTCVNNQSDAVEGKGSAPQTAIRDAMSRTSDRIDKLSQALKTLQNAEEEINAGGPS